MEITRWYKSKNTLGGKDKMSHKANDIVLEARIEKDYEDIYSGNYFPKRKKRVRKYGEHLLNYLKEKYEQRDRK